MPSAGELAKALEAEIDAYAAEHLPPDPAKWAKLFAKDKIIHDALWGTFALQAHEVALLDTSLIQRLRFLHQTGAVYLTYPSAHHTRFEHTLGVLCQTGRLCHALRSQQGEKRIDDAYERDVRFAALLHDTGHGPFSHTSEQFFAGLPMMDAYREAHPDLEQSGAGEILSYLLVQSSPFRRFLEAINSHFQVALDCNRIAGIITGTLAPGNMYMSEIVHGPFDADKLDYMPRDGMFSGLKMHVDIDRLYHSIRIKTAEYHGESQTRIAGGLSGLSPLTQIMFNKMLLFTGMYHHHKVRAVDCMLWAVFHLAMQRNTAVGGRRLKNPVDFIRLTDDKVITPDLTSDGDIRRIIDDIRGRRLWKKAIVIARNTVPPSMHDEAGENPSALFAGVARLAGNSREKVARRREIADAIWAAAGKPCEQHEVWLDIPKPPSVTEAKEMWIDSPGHDEPRILNDFIPVQKWVELYGAHQSRSHVFCPRDAVKPIGEASKRVFAERFGLEFLPEATLV
jgi:HD superfamily phosphohydrolase